MDYRETEFQTEIYDSYFSLQELKNIWMQKAFLLEREKKSWTVLKKTETFFWSSVNHNPVGQNKQPMKHK